jgi:hypothetical protein
MVMGLGSVEKGARWEVMVWNTVLAGGCAVRLGLEWALWWGGRLDGGVDGGVCGWFGVAVCGV